MQTREQDPHMRPDVRDIHNKLTIRGSQIASLNRLVIGDDRQVWEPGKKKKTTQA